ncbi:hypothetical protein B2J88_25445 [Rhodococcus sp. SRB_17]|uniref:DUF892 family protein n=1 Tax=Acidovorax sp. SRB_24 TaxID=1962700 RepID=UPI00145CADDB|nr:DUF892 family protein [Acidovorax sp. SRB_24]NMM77740.1 hypothetical protein [Acidovorax sp. SRB_24]NMM87662.1 hypothetical protein [Rhodococcus sp. SRB_17]
MKASEQNLTDWLREAHAMEEHAERMLTGAAARLGHCPRLQERLQLHACESRQQGRLLRECIERRGGAVPWGMPAVALAEPVAQCASGLRVSDAGAEAVLSVYAFKHLEIGSYRMLQSGAHQVGDTQTQQVCERILAQERAMADWLFGQIPAITQEFLQHADGPAETAHQAAP